ncbi:conserved hypothetical membrane protein [Mycobacterium ulcerans Agy99]|uniref:Conserved hypothetical membrane protein n=1 Tax=Mycobacterium ulcerans (strain Agy99) TaxID=362242 RepID=A0PQR5_MYCUA|nr:conserved hypothetical membrane protein [Mycobacterium ulcerans Agy99]OIN31974.1 hypothetical protein A3649_10685 [Mycobacterium ulcerans]
MGTELSPQPVASPRTWPLVALAIIAIVGVVLGAAALVVALTRPGNAGSAAAPTTTASPTYTAEEIAAAHQKLCEVYKLAAREVQIQTHGNNQALAVAAVVNGALMLQQAVDASPALTSSDRAAALALAEAFTNANAFGSNAHLDDAASQAAIDNANAKDEQMKAICGGG